MQRLHTDVWSSFCGEVFLAVDAAGCVRKMSFACGRNREAFEGELASTFDISRDSGPCGPLRQQLDEYAAKDRRHFDLELKPAGTPFQLRVWEALQAIPFGETISYGELARRVGEPHASRAVGQANNKNPIPIVIPCHRVIGADGALVGFGGGLENKVALVDFERGQGTLGAMFD